MRRLLSCLVFVAGCSGKAEECTFYADADGDGLGDPTVSVVVCDPGDGYVQDQSDCDDSDPLAGGGFDEVAYDGTDNDCDPSTPDDDLDGEG